jgi:cytochrome c2
LRTYLPNPRAAMPGTKMKFDGVPTSEEVEDIIAFLDTCK